MSPFFIAAAVLALLAVAAAALAVRPASRRLPTPQLLAPSRPAVHHGPFAPGTPVRPAHFALVDAAPRPRPVHGAPAGITFDAEPRDVQRPDARCFLTGQRVADCDCGAHPPRR